MFVRSFTAAIATFFSFALPSHALVLECNITPSNATGGYVTDLYVFESDEAAATAIVFDGLIMYYNNEQPVAAKVSEDTAKKLVLSWRLQITNSTGQQTNMQFRAAYFKADKSVIVRAVPGGDYSNNFEGRGKCKAT